MNINYTEVALGYGVSHPCESKFYSPGIVAQYSTDPRTGTISKSTKSSHRLTHSFKESRLGASMIWKQRAPAASTQLA